MGVVSLWPLLEPVRRTKSLQQLKGQKIAIDLSAWIMSCKRVAVASGFRNVYLRTIFLRTLDLLKNGIQPVFVCDGCIPKIKFNKIRHRWKGNSFGKSGPSFRERSQSDTTKICRNLFQCLGIPFIESAGEGEALCAFLNKEQIVTGCLTSDSDVLLYGATKVYRNYTKKKKVGYLESYDAKEISNQMKLDQRTFVALALLLGCDYNEAGVPGVGVKTAMRMVREMQLKAIDPLQRMLSWRTDPELQNLQEQLRTFNDDKHCKECLHIVASHSRNGCDLCADNIDVSEDLDDCQCYCHSFFDRFLSHEEELKVREKAMLDPTFPSQDVIEEFLIPTESKDTNVDINWHEPNFQDLQTFVQNHLHWNGHFLFKTLVPVLVHWKLNLSTFRCLEKMEPRRILKKHQADYQLLYQVEWSKMLDDVWTKDATYTCSVDRDLFRKRFPEMVKSYEDCLILPKTTKDLKKSLSNLSCRVTRASLKKEGLTFSEMEDGKKQLHTNIDKLKTPQTTPIRQSKRLMEIKKAVEANRFSVESNNVGVRRSIRSCRRHQYSIPNTVADIKKQNKIDSKVQNTGSRENVKITTNNHLNLFGIASSMLEKDQSIDDTQTVDTDKTVLDGQSNLHEKSRKNIIINKVFETGPNLETTATGLKDSLHGDSLPTVDLVVMESTVKKENAKDQTMIDGLNTVDSIAKRAENTDPTKITNSHTIDSKMEMLNKDVSVVNGLKNEHYTMKD